MGVTSSKVEPSDMGVKSLFVTRDLSEGQNLLASYQALRESFAAYIKSGVWIEQVLCLVPDSTNVSITHEARLAKEADNALLEYKHAKGTSHSLEGFDLPSEKRTTFSMFRTPRSSGSDSSLKNSIYSSDCYVDILESGRFTSAELISILFGVVYPLYLVSNEYRRFQAGLPLVEFDVSASVGAGSTKDLTAPKQYSQQARRTQEMLLSCAATFDETLLLDFLAKSAWTDTLKATFDTCGFGITVCDSNKDGAPIIYANKAFEMMSGYSASQLRGRSLDILNGRMTDSVTSATMRDALRQSFASKLVIHHCTAGGRQFLNLVSIRPCGGYSIVVHYPPSKAFKVEDLKAIDDLQALLGVVVRAPGLSKVRRAPSAWLLKPLASLRSSLSKRNLFGASKSSDFSGGLNDMN